MQNPKLTDNPAFLGLVLLGTVLLSLSQMGCGGTEAADRAKVQKQQAHYQQVQPIPFFEFSLERDAVIQTLQARNEEVATHTIWRDHGKVVGDCPSIGFPIPYDTSLTNPLQHAYSGMEGGHVIEQAEPNGVFQSKNSIATWVRCVEPEGVVPVYVEAMVETRPYPVEVDYVTGEVWRAGGESSVVLRDAEESRKAAEKKAAENPLER